MRGRLHILGVQRLRARADLFVRAGKLHLQGERFPVQPLLFGMIARRSGRIIVITSASGQSGQAGQVNYAASKAALAAAAAPAGRSPVFPGAWQRGDRVLSVQARALDNPASGSRVVFSVQKIKAL